MALKPLADRIVIKVIEDTEQTSGGIFIPDSAKEKPQKGEVVAVGEGKTNDKGEKEPLEVKVGDIMAVPKNMLPKADYTALGHIHTPQDLGDGVHYSGAITALSVNQKNLGVIMFETENGKLISKEITPLKSVARYEKVSVTSVEEAEELLLDYDNHDIVELEIVQNEPLSASRLKSLKKEFSCISNIALIRTFETGEQIGGKNRKHLKDTELFTQFYKSVRGVEPSKELIDLFVECKGENNEAN